MEGELKLSLKPLEDAKLLIANEVCTALGIDLKEAKGLAPKIQIANVHSRKSGSADVALRCFVLTRYQKGKKPQEIAQTLHEELKKKVGTSPVIQDITVSGPYLNIQLSMKFLGQVMTSVTKGDLLKALPQNKERVMIEYSQPNTHKAFHVGHMRNAALGDCLVRMFEFCGHPVVAANYFGDEGAHIAKCLWKTKRYVEEKKFDIDSIAEKDRAGWLGNMYSTAVSELALGNLTDLPFPNVIAAKVLEVKDHPAADAPKNWHVVTVQIGKDTKKTVVCGGRAYKVGDFVGYLPVGSRLKNKEIVEKDMKGILSCGVMLGYTEMGLSEPADPKPEKKAEEKVEEKVEETKVGKKKKKKGKGGGGKKSKKQKIKLPSKIYIVDPIYNPTPGVSLPELGKTAKDIEDVVAEIKKRNTEVGDLLRAMEEGDKEAVALWEKTKKWSLDEFKRIYAWLDCRFDHDFFESEVSESSRKLVIDLEKKGVLQKVQGAICANLEKFKLGFLILLKSNGAGLYATKDLQLAQIKFEQFKIDKSIYIVDASQSLHFKQVFKVLELMGYQQAKKCVHLPYGMVVLPSGKMSSRKGTVIVFTTLRKNLNDHLEKEYMAKYKGQWSPEEIENAKRQLAVGTIKYGMLNHDVAKDIVFEMSKWSAKTGTTGPYNMYAYTRTVGIKAKVDNGEAKCSLGKVDYSLLTSQLERDILVHICGFWAILDDCVARQNPSPMCSFVYNLSKLSNLWYENVNVLKSDTPDLLATRVEFAACVGKTIKTCLALLGITALERM
uniref:arginine--tRNA ligase n=1 Tax=Amorphochlora amoebiformis TaxID=1561963 RepID=A0A7S0GU64_9EUKA|mmetsp:Transcript_17715/g.28255  ORF Transcript_17715/g.28255 Transcript_17715/m.28255 type:complete len:778 (+) Transcript_17715:129-2462(+)